MLRCEKSKTRGFCDDMTMNSSGVTETRSGAESCVGHHSCFDANSLAYSRTLLGTQSIQGLLRCVLSTFKGLVCPHIAPISIAPGVGDSNFIQIAVDRSQ